MDTKSRSDQLLSTPAAAERLKIKPAQFRRLADKLGLGPEDWYKNPHYRSGPLCPLWKPDDVDRLVGGPEIAALRARSHKYREARKRKPKERRRMLAKRYPDWRDALPPAAEALFSLNRYAKWERCSPEHRDEIYELKNRMVEMVYQLGLAEEVKLHMVNRDALICWGCQGTGYRDCGRCQGTGYYREPDTVEYVAFRFRVGDSLYAWHQPRELVHWPFEVKHGIEQWQPEGEKPIKLNPHKFAGAKALIGYVLDCYKAELRSRQVEAHGEPLTNQQFPRLREASQDAASS